MYRNAAFAETDLSALDRLLERDSFVTLVTVRDDEPTVSHLPVLYSRAGDRVELRGHWAHPNPQAGHQGPALVIVRGPDAYVSPGWYPDKEAMARVPTWNYAVAHLRGELTTFDDGAALAALVSELSERNEKLVGGEWKFEPDRDDHFRQLRGIVGFRLVVSSVRMTFKLSQNHPPDNRASVARRLASQGTDRSRELAALMREHGG
ncbi:MAG: FMN-binding negative transcriptional regulator [Lysobacter sp.]|nr:FMN-binding negative transcriptional regulator [Lysobacter sp.]MDQ3268724.1 FMN-binding negative transcriptional regulator [Pseudomonadota bacterium]